VASLVLCFWRRTRCRVGSNWQAIRRAFGQWQVPVSGGTLLICEIGTKKTTESALPSQISEQESWGQLRWRCVASSGRVMGVTSFEGFRKRSSLLFLEGPRKILGTSRTQVGAVTPRDSFLAKCIHLAIRECLLSRCFE
jgi:hypothetical protein